MTDNNKETKVPEEYSDKHEWMKNTPYLFTRHGYRGEYRPMFKNSKWIGFCLRYVKADTGQIVQGYILDGITCETIKKWSNREVKQTL